MRISVGPGTYVVAVSGGVDSVVLLNLLSKQYGSKVQSPKLKEGHQPIQTLDSQILNSNRRFVVAHYDHGIRPESYLDREFVRDIARNHDLPFVHGSGKLGPGTSEAVARQARYAFLGQVQQASGAKAIITAHHEDDMLETAIINVLRGSGRRGLPALQSHEHLLRPLLSYSKDRLQDYARLHGLRWREDSTNQDLSYKRNYIRHRLLYRFSPGQRAQLRILLDDLNQLNREIDSHLDVLLHVQPAVDMLDRGWFINLPHAIAKEFTHAWLIRHNVKNISQSMIERLVRAMKTGKVGRRIDVDLHHVLLIKRRILALVDRER